MCGTSVVVTDLLGNAALPLGSAGTRLLDANTDFELQFSVSSCAIGTTFTGIYFECANTWGYSRQSLPFNLLVTIDCSDFTSYTVISSPINRALVLQQSMPTVYVVANEMFGLPSGCTTWPFTSCVTIS